MKNQLFALGLLVATISFTTMGYSENVVSLHPTTDITAAAVGTQVKIDLRIKGGKDVAGYSPLIAFNSTVLKFIDVTSGGYLPTGGLWIAPQLKDDGSYEVRLTTADVTTSGTSVDFPPLLEAPGVPVETITVDNLLFEVPEVPPEFASPGAAYWAFSFSASSPLGADTNPIPADGDGTLATFTFEVVAAKPAIIALLAVNLSDPYDAPLVETLEGDSTITVIAVEASGALSVDVNADGKVNILDLVSVAGKFGQPITDENKAADVNADGKINILDLVLIAQHFGN